MDIFLMALGTLVSALGLLCSMILPFVIGQSFAETAPGKYPTDRQKLARTFVWFVWAVAIVLVAKYSEWPWLFA